MKNKPLLKIIPGIALIAFIISELFISQLLVLNVAISLTAFLFLPLVISKLTTLKFHFSLIYLSYLGAFITVALLGKLDADVFVIASIVKILVTIGFLICTFVYEFNKVSSIKISRSGIDISYPFVPNNTPEYTVNTYENLNGSEKLLYFTKKAINSNRYIAILIFGVVFTLVLTFIFVRQPGSITALDLLQHQSVVNQVYSDSKVCLTPSDCNNLFLKDGYTTLYHSILFFISPSDDLIQQRLYSTDIAWVMISAIAIYMFANKFFESKKQKALVIGTILALLTFVNGAYEFSFFIPQAFAFFIFLIGYRKERMNKFHLASFILTLLMSHLIIGAFLTLFVLILEAIKRGMISVKSLTFVGTLGFIFAILLSALNLTIEKLIQAEEIKFLGNPTNKEFPTNVLEFVNVNPILVVPFLAIVILYLIGKIKERETFKLIPVALISATIYFMAPTYANKFLIGLGVYAGIVVCDVLFTYIKDNRKVVASLALLSLLTVVAFVSNYNAILTFYKTGDNAVSALNGKETGMINFLRKTNTECIIVTDPFSQVAITGLTRFETYEGQYMSPAYRQIIHTFQQNPTKENLKLVLEYPEEDVCFVYSYRLEEARAERIDAWANQLYYYVVDSKKTLNSSIFATKILGINMNLIYKDKYYYVYEPLEVVPSN